MSTATAPSTTHATSLPARSAMAPQYTWNATSLFADDDAWESELNSLLHDLSGIARFTGQLGSGPGHLADALAARDELRRRGWVLQVYTSMSYAVDTTNHKAAEMSGRADGALGQVLAACAFIEPEVLELGQARLQEWMQQEPRLAHYKHYFADLFRKQAHVRSAEVEEVLGMLADPFNGAWTVSSMLTNADLRFKPAAGSDGLRMDVSQSTFVHLMDHPDREVRRTAWENYLDQYLAFKNTLTSALQTSIKQSVFGMRARRYESTLAASLFPYNIPTDVFHNLIDVFKQNLPTWHRYWALRRQALGVETLHPYDVWAPLSAHPPHIPFEQAVDWICQGLAPLGEDYVAAMRHGCLEERWIDLYPNEGKSQGAFSTGAPGTHPFIMMGYTDSMRSLSTLAHELGHSMHSYLTWKHQPSVYGDYSLFAAEVASNFHQAMVRGYLLKANPDPAFQISLIEEAMSNFHRYFLVMPTLARFELEMHQRVEAGLGLTADSMIDRMAELFGEAFGPAMHIDRERVGITWATFGHLYADYYVFQYATGISGAHACARRILDGVEGAAADYRRFLSAGGSMYTLDALAMAGVDLSQPEAVEATFAVLADYVDRLESLLGAA